MVNVHNMALLTLVRSVDHQFAKKYLPNWPLSTIVEMDSAMISFKYMHIDFLETE